MADYYPLIARAIAGLDPNAPGESRRALYEKARAALIAQLRSVQPPLSESEITRERLSLEEAVRKVESEAAQRARDVSRRAIARPTADATAPAQDGSAASPRSRSSALPSRNERPPLAQEEGPPLGPERQAPPDQQRRQRAARAEASPQPQSSSSPPQLGMPDPQGRERPGEAPARRGAETDMGQSPRKRGFGDTAAGADDLGASRAARKSNTDVPSPSPEFDRLEPGMETHDDFEEPYSYDEDVEEAERQPSEPPPRIPEGEEREGKRGAGALFPFKTAIAVGIVLILAGAAMLWGRSVVSTVSGLFRSPPVEAPKDASAPLAKPKITDRVGQPSDQVAPVAQRVVLYDEDPTDPKGKQYVGTVVWRTEPIKASGNQQPDIAVHADIEIPDRNFKMTMSFRRNTDSSLPASHTAELTFMLPPDFSGGGIANVPGILMKSNEQARGTPLAGLAVKVTDGFFLVGLSNVEADLGKNIQLLKERSWFDVPLVYTNQRRAIIAIEKGPPGERAFNDAFAAWKE